MRLSWLAGLFLSLIAFAPVAQAQTFETFGNVGYGVTFRIEDDGPGNGIIWGFGAAFRPTPRIRLEGAIENLDVLSKPQDHVAGVLHPRASLAYEFSTADIRPFVVAGAGAARIRQIDTITFPTRVETREETETAFAVHFGGGFAFQAGRRVAIRPQVIVIPTVASRSNINLLHVSIQIAFAW